MLVGRVSACCHNKNTICNKMHVPPNRETVMISGSNKVGDSPTLSDERAVDVNARRRWLTQVKRRVQKKCVSWKLNKKTLKIINVVVVCLNSGFLPHSFLLLLRAICMTSWMNSLRKLNVKTRHRNAVVQRYRVCVTLIEAIYNYTIFKIGNVKY